MTPNFTLQQIINWRGHAYLALLSRLYLGFVFLYACWHKILHPSIFALDVATYQFLPLPLINIFAIILPWVELLSGALLVLAWRTRAAALLISGMMVMFMIGLSWALHLNLQMSCGCFASSETGDTISYLTLLRDAGWLALGLYVLFLDRQPIGVDSWLARRKNSRLSR